MIEYRCAWCGRHLYDRDTDDRTEHLVSHGICWECEGQVRQEWTMERAARLAGLGAGSVSKGGADSSSRAGGAVSTFPTAPPPSLSQEAPE